MKEQPMLIRWESIHCVPRERSASYSHGLASRSRGPDIPSAGSKIGLPSKRQAQNPPCNRPFQRKAQRLMNCAAKERISKLFSNKVFFHKLVHAQGGSSTEDFVGFLPVLVLDFGS